MELNKETCPCLSSEQIEGLIKGGIITVMNFLFESQQKVMDCGTLSNVVSEYYSVVFWIWNIDYVSCDDLCWIFNA